MGAETPVHAAYAKLDELGLDVPVFALRERLQAIGGEAWIRLAVATRRPSTRCRTT
jgi:hypothetical protein